MARTTVATASPIDGKKSGKGAGSSPAKDKSKVGKKDEEKTARKMTRLK